MLPGQVFDHRATQSTQVLAFKQICLGLRIRIIRESQLTAVTYFSICVDEVVLL